jgi:NAD kinase
MLHVCFYALWCDTCNQLKLRGLAPKALRWKRLEQRYRAHKSCVTDLLALLRKHHVNFSCVNRVEMDRQHLVNVDLVIAVGGDGTVLSAAHFLDHGTIPLLGINSDPNVSNEDRIVKLKTTDERRSHGALCLCTSNNMEQHLIEVLYGNGQLEPRTRIQCTVKSTFSETRLVPALNDLLLANPSPAAVSRFRMGWLQHSTTTIIPATTTSSPLLPPSSNVTATTTNMSLTDPSSALSLTNTAHLTNETPYGTVTRFGGSTYDVLNSINVWSSGMWVCTATGSTAASTYTQP